MERLLIQELTEKTMLGRISFPEVVRALAEAGIESYHIDYLRGEARYYGSQGETLLTPFGEAKTVAKEFNALRIQSTIKRIQAAEITYPEFAAECAAAGCSNYIVYIGGKMVKYLGRDGEEHVERFPSSR